MNDDIGPLIDPEKLDPEKFFDDGNYSTVVVNTEEFSHKHKQQLKDMVELFVSGNREDKDEALLLLKKEDGKEILMEACVANEFKEHRPLLVAACWESGLDFSKYFDIFLLFAVKGNFHLAMEAITVIENMEELKDKEKLNAAIKQLQEELPSQMEKKDLISDLIFHLESLAA